MAKSMKILIPVKVYEKETMVANENELCKQLQVVAIPKKIYVDKKNAQQVVRNVMLQQYGQKKYTQKFNLGVKGW